MLKIMNTRFSNFQAFNTFALSIVFLFSVVFCSSARAQNEIKKEIDIIPQPKSVSRTPGEFEFTGKTKLFAADAKSRETAAIFNDLLLKNYGFKLDSAEKQPDKNAIVFTSTQTNGTAAAESYDLIIAPREIRIAGDAAGQFYAVQTLMQILPVDFKKTARVPAVRIVDEPRFSYRGMHLDVARHFFPVEFVKKYIDLIAQYKFNRFHWHLTDDQGWRIEIKKYPKLTEIGSRRPETVVERNLNPYVGDNTPVEGFYTQEQIKDVVAYAKARQITVIPEIELPGHASAALAAHPELGCKENYQYKAQTTWGIFKEVFCPTDATFRFLEDVLTETIALFPDSPYIHIGGDEVLKDHWKESAFVQELKRRENLKDEHEVQSYFIRRIEKFVNSKNRKIIGWDEILEGGLAPNAVVMSWRGEKGGIEAAKSKHDVVMTPANALYFDYGQGDTAYEPLNIGNFVPLETVYAYNPIPKELTETEAKYVLGAQANVWTEYIKTPEKVEYMVFPRILALAEVVWSPTEARNYADFSRRILSHYRRLDRQNVNYRIPAPIGLRNIILGDAATAKIELRAPLSDAKIFYTLDGSAPDEQSKLYEKPFALNLKPGEKTEVKTVVVNEKGRKSVVHAAVILRREPLKALELSEKTAGVNLKFYKGAFQSIKEMNAAQPFETGETKSVMLPQFAKKTDDLREAFGAAFDGYIYAPEDAIYEFEIESADGATLAVGGETIVDLSDAREKQKKTGLVPLSKGYHRFEMRYFQTGGAAVLNLRWGIKGTGLRRIYGNELFR